MELKHPITGQHAHASAATGAKLLNEGWELLAGSDSQAAPDDAAPVEETKNADNDDDGAPEPPAPTPEKPLNKMKLGELIEYAEKIGVAAEEIEPLRKPGASKAQALEIIGAHAS